MPNAALVYQGGIANVFALEYSNAIGGWLENQNKRKRLLQGTFQECLWFARGLKAAGWLVNTYACNKAKDITNEVWTDDLESQPFSDELIRV